MKPKNNKKCQKALSTKTKHLITALSIVVSLLSGFCYWWFISRCADIHCFYHFVPLRELFVGLFAGWTTPLSFLNLNDNILLRRK